MCGFIRDFKVAHYLITEFLARPNVQDTISARHAHARYHYNVVLRPEPEGGFTAMVPALPGCVTYGRDLNEARRMVKDAISGYVESLKKHELSDHGRA